MNAIFSCKMYKGSSRKDRIRAALADPINTELVTQLASYLDDEQLADMSGEAEELPASAEPADMNPEEADVTETPETEEDSSDSMFDDMVFDDESDSSSDDADEVPPGEQVFDDLSGSTSIGPMQPVTASHCIQSELDCDSIQGLLNMRQETQGVSRIRMRDDELWIYYNDKTNLNNVMEAVISVLNGSGYTSLEFNRLARSDNAIVFQLVSGTTPVEPLNAEEENE